MYQPVSRFWKASHDLAGNLLLVFAVFGLAEQSAAGESDPAPRPRIADVQIGFGNHYKLGFWTRVHVELENTESLTESRVSVVAVDSDGVKTTASGRVLPLVSPGLHPVADIYTKVGRIGAPIRVQLLAGNQILDEETLHAQIKAGGESTARPLPATGELFVSLSSAPTGLKIAFPDRDSDAGQLARQVVELNQVHDLPTEWFGYDASDVVLISAGDGKICQSLATDRLRYAALARWVELGGRLVILCSGQTAQKFFAEGQPLADFAPGKLADVVRIPATGPIEHFAGAAPQIPPAAGATLRLARFTDVAGNIEVYAGRKTSDLPIVVRSAHGLGEVAFAGVDVSETPLADWPGRGAFLQALVRPYLATITSSDVPGRLVTRGYNDLAGALRQRLGQSFASVASIGFATVAGLAIAYIVFLGPLDYLFVNRWLRRPWLAWISFPVIVVAFCAGAISLGEWRKGPAMSQVNRLELIDVDTLSGRTRGVFWGTLYSPTASQLDLSVQIAQPRTDSTGEGDVVFSWWGLPGVGIGGMQAGGIDPGMVHGGYTYGAERKSLTGVPVLESATKSLMARWTSHVPPTLEASLTDQDGLAVGSITNLTGRRLRNVRLLYGTWAYFLGSLNPGKHIEVSEESNPRKVKTIVMHDVLGDAAATGPLEGRVFTAEQASAKQILNVMMFYDAAGGFGFAHLPNRYQAYCDLSRLLDLGRAILVADVDAPVARLTDDATKNTIRDNPDESAVIYRFVLPVKRHPTP